MLAYVWLYRGQHERARPLVDEGLRLARGLGDRRQIAAHLSGLAILNSDVALMEQSLALYREVEDVRNIAQMLAHLGFGFLFIVGDVERAETALREGLDLARTLVDISTVALHLHGLGRAALERGDVDRARDCFTESLACERSIGRQSNIADCLEGLADVALHGGRPERVARMLGAAEALRERSGEPLAPFRRPGYERMLAELRIQLSPAEFDRAWASGRTLSADDAAELALGAHPAPRPAPVAAFPKGLSAREVDVLRLVAEGLSDAEVAERLFLARRTVNTHLTSIYTKLRVNSRSAATRFAVEHGLT